MSICKDTKRVISTNVLIYTNGTLQTYTKRLIITLPPESILLSFLYSSESLLISSVLVKDQQWLLFRLNLLEYIVRI